MRRSRSTIVRMGVIRTGRRRCHSRERGNPTSNAALKKKLDARLRRHDKIDSASIPKRRHALARAGGDLRVAEIRLEQVRAHAKTGRTRPAPFLHIASADPAHGIDGHVFRQYCQQRLQMRSTGCGCGETASACARPPQSPRRLRWACRSLASPTIFLSTPRLITAGLVLGVTSSLPPALATRSTSAGSNTVPAPVRQRSP